MSGAAFVVTGTDTEIGKTVFAAGLAGALKAHYWKPVQAGLEDGSDRDRVAALSGLPAANVLPEAYRLTTPCSPHEAAARDGIAIDGARLDPPPQRPLVIEGAGGALVPLTPSILFADVFARWGLPVILVARTGLGTINHSLLTIECLRTRGIAIHGIAFVGDGNAESESTIMRIGGVPRLGRLPMLEPLTPDTLSAAFAANFRLEDFL